MDQQTTTSSDHASAARRVETPIRSSSESLVATPIEGRFAVEVTGPPCEDWTDEHVLELKALLDERQVVVIRSQNLDERKQIDFSSKFGELRHVGHSKQGGLLGVFNNQDNSNLFYRRDNTCQAPSQFWHCASSTKEAQHITFLHVKVAPLKAGGTSFLNTRLAYEDLDPTLKNAIRDKMACHSAEHVYQFLKERGFYRCGSMSEQETNAMIALRTFTAPPVFHPVVVSKPNGSKALFINPLFTSHIDGMGEEESHQLLTRLYEHCEQDRYLYTHEWRKGDVLVWDQFFTIHKGLPCDRRTLRILHKTSTFSPVSELSHYKTDEHNEVYERMKLTYRW